MGKRAPSPPPAPDVEAIIRAQQQANAQAARQNAVLNRTNQSTPFGSLTWQQNGVDPETGMPIWSSSVQLSPQQQQLLDQYQGIQGMRGNMAQQLLQQNGQAMLNPLARMQGAPGIYMPNPQGGQGQWLGGPSPFGQGPQGGAPPMPQMPPMPQGGPPAMGAPGGAPGGKGAAGQPPPVGGTALAGMNPAAIPLGSAGGTGGEQPPRGAMLAALANALRGG